MANEAKRKKALSLSNLRLARSKWGDVDRLAVQRLKTLLERAATFHRVRRSSTSRVADGT